MKNARDVILSACEQDEYCPVIAIFCRSGRHRSVAVSEIIKYCLELDKGDLNLTTWHFGKQFWHRTTCQGRCRQCASNCVTRELEIAADIWYGNWSGWLCHQSLVGCATRAAAMIKLHSLRLAQSKIWLAQSEILQSVPLPEKKKDHWKQARLRKARNGYGTSQMYIHAYLYIYSGRRENRGQRGRQEEGNREKEREENRDRE